MVTTTIEVKGKETQFSYELSQPETLKEALDTFGEKECFEWLLSGRKTEINAQQWSANREKTTEKVEVNGKAFKVPKELAAILRQAGVGAGVAA